jgi:hypothetical protein
VINDNFGIIEGLMTTVHAITGEFSLRWAAFPPKIIEKIFVGL